MFGKCQCAEGCTFGQALDRLPASRAHAQLLISRLKLLAPFPADARILDIGAAQGRFLIAFAKMGLQASGLEPWEDAIRVAEQLADHERVSIQIVAGFAEDIPFPAESFHIVHARSVMEHVRDPQAAFSEAFRVLKPGGLFWFATASSLCPRQQEISGFPCFGWYPDRLKRRIMRWAATRKPHLVGHTSTPAMNWFTPWKARRMLSRAGFAQVYDRWDMPCLPDTARGKRLAFRIIGAHPAAKFLADVLRQGCAFAARKQPTGEDGEQHAQ